jgi:hypothetical protein
LAVTYYYIAIWTAVGINLLAAANYMYWTWRYRRKIDEVEDLLKDLHNMHSIYEEHVPLMRDR